jgi:hypothetical protein
MTTFHAAADDAREALTCLTEAPPGWDIECRGDAIRAIRAMMVAARTTSEILDVISMRAFLLQTSKGKLRPQDP